MRQNLRIYKNEEIRTFLESHRDRFVRKLFEQKLKSIKEYDDSLAMGTFTMPSLKAVRKLKKGSRKEALEKDLDKLIPASGIVRLNADIQEEMMDDELEPSPSPNAPLTSECLKKLRADEADFPELSFDLNKETNVPPKQV